jgi:hypothetical protein
MNYLIERKRKMILTATICTFRRKDGAEKEDGVIVFPNEDKAIIIDHDGKIVLSPIWNLEIHYYLGSVYYDGRKLKKELRD